MPQFRWTVAALLIVPGLAAGEEPARRFFTEGDAALELRYRFESVDQAGKPLTADANTLKLRGNLASGEVHGFTAFLELDHVAAIGGEHYDDTRNRLSDYPVVADPEGTDLNQAWLQYAPAPETRLRLGRQRINFDNQRFLGSSDWRQNEQTLDALRVETTALRGAAINYAFFDRVRRVFGPEDGTPPATLDGASHLFNARLTSLPVGSLVAYAYLLDFDDAPELSSRTVGARYEGTRSISEGLSFGWALEYARQRDAAENPLNVDAHYGLTELHLKNAEVDVFAGLEILSGSAGDPDTSGNRAFQTPLATLHKWQGWADKFTSTPPAGMQDAYVGISARRSGWSAQAVWHDFWANATSLHYGSELDLSIGYKLANRVDLLFKLADYNADEGFTDTQKFWAQLGIAF